jgi:hypothetical protein
MIMKIRSLVLAVLLGGSLLQGSPARADHTSQIADCVVDIDSASADSPHLVDPEGDWNGLSGNGAEDGVGELYREGVDITAAWFARDAEGGIDAVTQIASLSDLQPNTIFYLLWYSPDTDGVAPDRSTRWVSARIRGYAEPTYTYGHMAQGLTGIQFFTDGETTGTVATGTPGTISVDIPLEEMGIDASAGEYFTFADLAGIFGGLLGAESRILLGSPEPLPPPSPLRHGFVYEADTSDNFLEICDARL